MKRIILLLAILFAYEISYADSWDISTIYETKDVPQNCKALDSYGNPITLYGSSLQTIDKLLVPCSINNGKYKVTIIEISSGFYKIKDTDFYLEMKGTNYFGPTSIVNKSADVTLVKEGYIFRIEYKGMY
ncbi:MAG: hypothetical protein K2G07_01970 [Muribaculaceae bacterium]|nr:hypothetical protein [Muribaculaceae bacterium]